MSMIGITRTITSRLPIANLAAVALGGGEADRDLAQAVLTRIYEKAPGLVDMIQKHQTVTKCGNDMEARLNYVFISADEFYEIIEEEKKLAVERYKAMYAGLKTARAAKKEKQEQQEDPQLELGI